MGDQLYQIFQDGYHRAASGSPLGATGLPPAQAYNGTGYPPALTPINEFTAPGHGFIQTNGWSPYPGSDLDFPAMASRGGYSNQQLHQQQPQQPGQSQQQQQQLFHGAEFYDGTLSNFPTYPSAPSVPAPELLMQPDPFSAAAGSQCLDYNSSVAYAGANVWPKQELHNGYQPRSVLEQEDVKGVFSLAQNPDQNNPFFATSSEGLSDPVSPSDSHPGSPRSPVSVGPSSVPESKRKSGAAGKAANGSGGGRGKRKKTDEVADPLHRMVKEKERRVSNNSRERMRIRDINDALTELGRVCMSLRPMGKANAEKPQTKLGVLNMAVDVIMQLEKKVRERNLNPSTVALQHRSSTSVPPNPSSSSAAGSAPPPFQNPFPSMQR